MTIPPNPYPSEFPVQDRAIAGVFHEREKAEAAVADLQSAGFHTDEIGMVARTDIGDWSNYAGKIVDREPSPAAEGMVTGAAAGAGLGSLWALGIAAGALPAIGPVVAGGILGSVLASAAAGAATGGILGALIATGLSDDEANYYEEQVKAGRVIIVVRAGDRNAEAAQIFRAHGAVDIESGRIKTSQPGNYI